MAKVLISFEALKGLNPINISISRTTKRYPEKLGSLTPVQYQHQAALKTLI